MGYLRVAYYAVERLPLGIWTIALALATCASACAGSQRAAELQPLIGRATRDYVDETRARWMGSGARPLSVVVWYPAAVGSVESDWLLGPPTDPLFRLGRSAVDAAVAPLGSKRPLVLLSHGTGGSAAMLAWLAEPLARAGYVVVGLNHHGNTAAEDLPTPEGFMLSWERAVDLSRVLDRVLDDAKFGPLIDSSRVGAAGFSLGGYSVVAVTGGRVSLSQWEAFCASAQRDSTCEPQPEFPNAFVEFEKIRNRPDVLASLEHHGDSFRDTRFKAAFAMAPVGSWLTSASLSEVSVPMRIVVGAEDRTTPVATNAKRISGMIPGAQLLVLERVGHYSLLAECTASGMKQRTDLCHEESGVERANVHRRVAADAEAFFDSVLRKP